LIGNRPLLELSPQRPRGDRACLRARDSSGVFLNPNSKPPEAVAHSASLEAGRSPVYFQHSCSCGVGCEKF
jgi:hypothetical protein